MITSITVKKKLLINLGNFSNLTIEAEATGSEGTTWEELWSQINGEIKEQEVIEKAARTTVAQGPKRPLKEGSAF